MVHILLLHLTRRWKSGIYSSLWSMVVDYATYIYIYNNNIPNEACITPNDLFTGTHTPRYKQQDIHVRGCLVYVSDHNIE